MKRLFNALSITVAIALTIGVSSVRANNTTHSLLGIDVSNNNGSINWTSVHGDGVAYAFAKAVEGTGFTDSFFSGNMSNGKNAGLQMGAYDFCHPESGCPSAEVNHFWAVAGGKITTDGKSLYPMADCEVFNGVGCSEGSYTTWYNDWSTDVKSHTGNFLHPVIYVSACNASHLTTAITLSAFIADYNGQNLYTGNPWSFCCSDDRWGSTACGANTWTYWQVSSTGRISGVSGNCDLDAYNGTLSELVSWQGV